MSLGAMVFFISYSPIILWVIRIKIFLISYTDNFCTLFMVEGNVAISCWWNYSQRGSLCTFHRYSVLSKYCNLIIDSYFLSTFLILWYLGCSIMSLAICQVYWYYSYLIAKDKWIRLWYFCRSTPVLIFLPLLNGYCDAKVSPSY